MLILWDILFEFFFATRIVNKLFYEIDQRHITTFNPNGRDTIFFLILIKSYNKTFTCSLHKK